MGLTAYRGTKGLKKIKYFTAFLAAAALAAAVVIFAWHQGAFLPGWIEWQDKELEIETMPKLSTETSNVSDSWDLEQDIDMQTGADMQTGGVLHTTLTDRHLQVKKDEELVWETTSKIKVQDFLWCDINHDGADELLLLCWRIGRYGDARPFWVDRDEHAWSQHIYIYEWRAESETIYPLWMASDIGMDVVSWSFDEDERLLITETSGRQTSWDWVSWGLSLMKETQPGS